MNAGIRRIGLTSLWIVTSWFSGIGTGHAQECASDADCDAGFACRVGKELRCSGGGCMGGTAGSTGTAGTGDPMEPVDGGTPGGAGSGGCEDPEPSVCEAVTAGYCEQGQCAGDADCRTGTLCLAQSSMRCELVDPCPGQTSCVVDPEEVETVCFEQSASFCIARNTLACSTDADCGGGFSCVPGGEVCTCDGGGSMDGGSSMGGAGTGGSAGGDPGMGGMGSECTCMEVNYCELQLLPCESDASCPSPFSCVPNPCSGCGGGTAGAGGGPAEQDAGVAGGGMMEEPPPTAGSGCEPDPTGPALVCRPPDYLGYFGCPGGGSMGGSGGNTGGGGMSGEAGAGESDGGVPPGGGNTAGTGGTGGGPGQAGSGGDEDDDGHHHWPRFRFGCAASGAGASDALSSFALVGLCLLGLRRRARRAG